MIKVKNNLKTNKAKISKYSNIIFKVKFAFFIYNCMIENIKVVESAKSYIFFKIYRN